MSTIRQFEEMVVWKKARELTKDVYLALRDCQDRGFKDQIQRASVSVMSNIAEGFERGTRQEFLNYLFIAKGSAGEVRAQLYAALDIGYMDIQTFKRLNALAIECSKLLYSFTVKLKGTEVSGLQHKAAPKKDVIEDLIREHDPAIWEKLYKPSEN